MYHTNRVCVSLKQYQTLCFSGVQVTLDVPLARGAEIKLPLVILLGSPKPHQQKPKRSIWFRKLPG